MKNITVSRLALVLLFGTIIPSNLCQSTPNGDYIKCKEGSDVFDPPECPDTDPGLPIYFPFPYDCTQYFECTKGIARCIKCAPGTEWDQANLICNHPAAANCTKLNTTLPTTTTTTPTTTTPTTPVPTTEKDDPINWICPEGYVGLIRHPYVCTQFYHCDPARRPCLFDCPFRPVQYFSPVTNRCEYPADVPDCQGGSPPPTTTTPKYNEDGKSLNYRNVDRNNFAETVKYVAKVLKERFTGETFADPCDEIKTYLSVP